MDILVKGDSAANVMAQSAMEAKYVKTAARALTLNR